VDGLAADRTRREAQVYRLAVYVQRDGVLGVEHQVGCRLVAVANVHTQKKDILMADHQRHLVAGIQIQKEESILKVGHQAELVADIHI